MLTIHQKLLNAAATDETTATTPRSFKNSGTKSLTSVIAWATGVSSGVVEVEGADDPDATGDWAPIATVTFAGTAPKKDYVSHEGPWGAIRHRISTAVADGTVTTTIRGND